MAEASNECILGDGTSVCEEQYSYPEITSLRSIDLEVQECGQFLTDEAFAKARLSISRPMQGPHWPHLIHQLVWPPEPKKENEILTTNSDLDGVFFHPDRFEVVLDARGFDPINLRCLMKNNRVEVLAEQIGTVHEPNFPVSQRTRSMHRVYHLPRLISCDLGECLISSEGILVVSAPWVSEDSGP